MPQTIIVKLKIAELKREARKHYINYHNQLDEVDCGKQMLEYVSTSFCEARDKFNSIMDELSKIDPTCPKGRL